MTDAKAEAQAQHIGEDCPRCDGELSLLHSPLAYHVCNKCHAQFTVIYLDNLQTKKGGGAMSETKAEAQALFKIRDLLDIMLSDDDLTDEKLRDHSETTIPQAHQIACDAIREVLTAQPEPNPDAPKCSRCNDSGITQSEGNVPAMCDCAAVLPECREPEPAGELPE